MIVRLTLAAALLTGATAAQARDTAPAAVTPSGEKIICKYYEESGSLVKRTKKCYTRVQWDRIAEAARANGQRMTSDHAAGLALSN